MRADFRPLLPGYAIRMPHLPAEEEEVTRTFTPATLAIWREIETRLGTYVRGELLLMTSIGVLAGLGYWAIGLPFPLALGALAGLLEFVPMVGPTLGAIPAVLVALAISPQAALLVVIYSVVIQVSENNILVPRLMGHSVGVSPVAAWYSRTPGI